MVIGIEFLKILFRTKRSWKPNVQKKKLESEILGQDFKVNVTTKAYKVIQGTGGLDKFLIEKPYLIKDSRFGQETRQKILEQIRENQRAEIAKETKELRRERKGALPLSALLI